MDKAMRTMEWLELLYRIYTRRRVAELLEVSTVTLIRWERGWKSMDAKLEKQFYGMANEKIVLLKEDGDDMEVITAKQAERRMKELMTITTSAALTKRQRVNQLIYTMCANSKALYSDLCAATLKEGISTTLLNMEADSMGVVRERHGMGRRSYSTWTLPVDGLKKRPNSEIVDELEAAEQLLRDWLPCHYRDIREAARSERLSDKVIDMAAGALGVKRMDGMAAGSWWYLFDGQKEE